jgi:hypothetical protein
MLLMYFKSRWSGGALDFICLKNVFFVSWVFLCLSRSQSVSMHLSLFRACNSPLHDSEDSFDFKRKSCPPQMLPLGYHVFTPLRRFVRVYNLS